MPVDAVSLAGAIRQSRLLEPAQTDELGRLQAACPDPRALAADLVRRGWLTPFQVGQLMQGRGPELLLGSYVLLERLGEGGFGQVFKARNWKLGHVVALKLIRKERLDNPDAVRRFHREIRAAAQLDHPNIVRAFDADEVHGTHILVMEYVQGTDLAKVVKQGGPLPVDRACDYARQAAVGLQHAHERGLVHRDIKPQNLLLTPSEIVKILDMGMARLGHAVEDGEASSTMTQEGTVMGTLDYIAPEQAMNSHAVDIRADLYSLGCTLYFLLTGRVPFPGGTAMEKLLKHRLDEPVPVEQRRQGVPSAVAAVVRKLMAKRPVDRFQTPTHAATALASAARGDSPTSDAAVGAAPAAVHTMETPAAGWSSVVADRMTDEAAALRRRRSAGRSWRWIGVGTAIGVVLLALGLTVFFLALPRPPSPSAPTPRPAVVAPPRGNADAPTFGQWVDETAALPAERQAEAVAAKLKERNPGFDGPVTPTLDNGVVTGLEFLTDNVTDISPVRALPGLKRLNCRGSNLGKGLLSDLSPLKGMPLTSLNCSFTKVSDLVPLKDMKLTRLQCAHTLVSDLAPLKGMPITDLDFAVTPVSDLSPLRGMPLTGLGCGGTKVSDLSPLRGMPLTSLYCNGTAVTDLGPLKDVPLAFLCCDFKPERDAELLRSIKTLEKINDKPAAELLK